MLIQTRFIAPTNTRGARVKAWIVGRDSIKPVTVGFHDTSDCAHDNAAKTLADKLTRPGQPLAVYRGKPWFLCAGTDDRRGYHYVVGIYSSTAAAICEAFTV